MTLLVTFGLPGMMFTWGRTALGALAAELPGTCGMVEVQTLEQLREAWASRKTDNLIVVSSYPDAELCAFLMKSRMPYLAFVENPLDSLAWMIRTTNSDAVPLLRALSASISCVSQLQTYARLIPVNRNTVGKVQVDRILNVFVRALKLDLTPEAVARCTVKLGGAADGTQIPTLEEAAAASYGAAYGPPGQLSSIPADLIDIAEDVLEPFKETVFRPPSSAIRWPLRAFLSADRLGEPVGGEIDLVGRARCVIYGPYLHLPPGQWIARFSMRIEENLYGQIFTIEIHNSQLLGRMRVKPESTGSFVAELDFTAEVPMEAIEIRLFTESGAIEGAIADWSVEMLFRSHLEQGEKPETVVADEENPGHDATEPQAPTMSAADH